MSKATNESQQIDDGAKQHIALSFALDKVTNELKVSLTETSEPQDVDLLSIRKHLKNPAFGNIDVKDETLLSIMRRARKGETGEFTVASAGKFMNIRFEYSPEKRELFAILAMSAQQQDLSYDGIQSKISDAGYGNFSITQVAVKELATKAKLNQDGKFLIGKKPEYTTVKFLLDNESGVLSADLRASEMEVHFDLDMAKHELDSLGYSSFFFEAGALNQLVSKVSQNERGRFAIGKRKDAHVSFEFDEDFMTAFVSVSPPFGGRDLDESLLNLAMANAGIYKECCDASAVKKVLAEKAADKLVFAKGMAPKDGKDAVFEPLVTEVEYNAPKASKTGQIDLREVVNFTIIDAGTALMRRIPAIQGTNGRNVKGQVIPAYEGEDFPFSENLAGADICPDEPDLLRSTCKGHPVLLQRGVRVDNTVTVNNVDMSTGNIDYDGSVLVKGEVKAGMRIRVTGDIIVKGVVTKALLQAKNNITVECGIIGSDPAKDGDESPPTVIKAGGNVQAQYINLAEIHAGRDVIVREYLSHCHTHAKHQIIAGQSGGKGRIFGGECYGHSGIFANSIGASGGVKTIISVGTPPDQTRQFEQLVKSNENRQKQAENLKDMLKKYEDAYIANPADTQKAQKAQAIKKVMTDIQKDIKKMSVTIDKIKRVFKESNRAEVSVAKNTFPSVEININGAEFYIRQESKGGIFVKQGTDIRWKNFKRR